MEADSNSKGLEEKLEMNVSLSSKKEVFLKQEHVLFDRISGLAEKVCL